MVVARVYAAAQCQDKDPFWKPLINLNQVIDMPWCFMNDFIELASLNEKKGWLVLYDNKSQRLNEFLPIN